MEIKPDDKICLVSRSKCHLMLGDAQSALKDAEASLGDDKEFNKACIQEFHLKLGLNYPELNLDIIFNKFKYKL